MRSDTIRRTKHNIISSRPKAKEAVHRNSQALKLLSPDLARDASFIAELVRRDPDLFEDLRKSWGDNDRIAQIAVQGEALNLQHASARLRNNKQLVLSAVRQTGDALKFASPKLRGDRDVVLAAVNCKIIIKAWHGKVVEAFGYSLQYASAKLKADASLVMAAVQNEGVALRYASAALRKDPDIVRAAVKNDPAALEFAHKSLKGDLKAVLPALKKKPGILPFLSNELQAIIREEQQGNPELTPWAALDRHVARGKEQRSMERLAKRAAKEALGKRLQPTPAHLRQGPSGGM